MTRARDLADYIATGVTDTELDLLDGLTATTAELNILDGVTATATELNLIDGVTATTAELNILDGVTSTAAELNILDGVTATATELNLIDGVTSTTDELNILDGVTSTTAELNYNDTGAAVGTVVASKTVTVDANKDASSFRNITMAGDLSIGGDLVTTSNATLDLAPNGTGTVVVRGNSNSGAIVFNCESNSHGQKVFGQPHSASVTNTLMLPAGANSTLVSLVSTDTLTNKTLTSPKVNEDVAVTSTATELNLLDGVTATTAELNILDGVTSTAAELNILDGVTSTAAELNALDGITAVVGELNALDIGSTAVGTAVASKAVILDSNKDYTGIRNLTISGELDAATLDISGNVDVDGVLETDNLTINGAQGTDGQVLTSTGSGVGWEDAAGGAFDLIGNQALSDGANSTHNFTSLSAYLMVRVIVTGRDDGGGQQAIISPGEDGGSGNDPRTSNVEGGVIRGESGGNATVSGHNTAYLNGYVAADGNKGYMLTYDLYNFNKAAQTAFSFQGSSPQSTEVVASGGGIIDVAEAYDYVRVTMESPSSTGRIIVLGVKG